VISVKDYKLLVDAGDSIARALLHQNISVNSINGILISHLHPDHFSGFASLIVQMQMNDRAEPLFVFVHQTLITKVKEFLTLSYIFMERMKFPLQFIGFDTEAEISVSPILSFISRENTHLNEYQKYNPELSYISESFLFKSGEEAVYYSGDLGSSNDLFLFDDHKINVFITEAAHVDLESILKVSEKLNPGRIILTHLETEDIPVLKRNIRSIKNHKILMAEDGLKISV
jgi:ribonuclease BN (tRNA processing enzyme)